MSGSEKAAARLAALAVLLLVAAAALRGHLPADDDPADRRPDGGSAAAMVLLDVVITAALVVVAFAIIVRIREHRVAASSFGALTAPPDYPISRPSRRLVLIAAAVISAGLLLTVLLAHLLARYRIGELPVSAPVPRDAGSAPAGPPDRVPEPPQQPGQPPPSRALYDYFLTTLVVLVALTALGAVVTRTRRGVGAAADRGVVAPPAAAGPESLARAATLGLAEIADPGCEPRAAIIRCYATMERELADVPGAAPQECDTPTEVLSRAVSRRVLAPDNARRLVNLFTEARFSPHLMTEQHRETAIGALRLVLDELGIMS